MGVYCAVFKRTSDPIVAGRKAYLYVRMSTEAQLAGDSLRRQAENGEAFCRRHGLILSDSEYTDIGRSAYSGAHVKNGALGRFLAALQAGCIDRGSYLVMESLDRLSRQKEGVALCQLLDILRSGVSVVTTDGTVYSLDTLSVLEIFQAGIQASTAFIESDKKRERLSEVWKRKRAEATRTKMTGKCPAWLQLDRERNVFVPVPERVAVVRQIFERASAGDGALLITKKLNGGKIPTFSGKVGWHVSSVKKILANRAVLGECQPHVSKPERHPVGSPIADYFPQVVSPALFLQAQAARKSRARTGGPPSTSDANVFGRILVCARCGSRVEVVNKAHKRSIPSRFLRCTSSARGLGCPSKLFSYPKFESAFLLGIPEVGAIRALLPETVPPTLVDLRSQHADLMLRVEQANRVADRLLKARAMRRSW
jgi:DNA invertase Pin-like site-specific DNA recombinase